MLGRNELRQAFDKVDKDNSGSIDLSELEALCKTLNKPIEHSKVQELFNEIDTNHDGKLSFAEFIAWFRLGHNTKLKAILKQQLVNIAFFNNVTDNTLKKSNTIGDGAELNNLAEKKTLIDLEFIDGTPGNKSEAHVRYGGAPDEHIKGMVQDACPGFLEYCGESDTSAYIWYVLKAKNVTLLKEVFVKFFESFIEFVIEMRPEFEEILKPMRYQIGTSGEHVVAVFDLISLPLISGYLEMMADTVG